MGMFCERSRTITSHCDANSCLHVVCCFFQATKTAINAVAPIEPFKLFHRIGEYSKQITPPLEKTEMVHSVTGRSTRPAGLSQLGYACFWPDGGGLTEGMLHPSHPDYTEPSDHASDSEDAS